MSNLFTATINSIDGNPLRRPTEYAFYSADVIIQEDHQFDPNNAFIEYSSARYYTESTAEDIINAANQYSTEQFEATIINIDGNPLNIPLQMGFPIKGVILTPETGVDGADTYIRYKNRAFYAIETITALVAEANSGIEPETPITPADPTAKVGLMVVNGSSTQFMRSDAAPPIDESIVPTWTGIHQFNGSTGSSTPSIIVGEITPEIRWFTSNGAANDKYTKMIVQSGGFSMGGGTDGTNGNNLTSYFYQMLRASGNATQHKWFTGGSVARFTITDNDLAAGDAYAPINPKSLATKEYVDTRLPVVVAGDGKNAQSANINSPTLYAVPTSGIYRVSAYVVQTRAATTSSTLPSCSVSYTEATTGVGLQDIVTLTANTNTVGLHVGGSVIISAQLGSNIGYITSNYASSGATSMQYSIHMKIEFLG